MYTDGYEPWSFKVERTVAKFAAVGIGVLIVNGMLKNPLMRFLLKWTLILSTIIFLIGGIVTINQMNDSEFKEFQIRWGLEKTESEKYKEHLYDDIDYSYQEE